MTTDMSLDISIGFFSSPDTAAYPGFGDGGIRISVNGFVLTRYNTSYDGFARYDASGNQLENTEEYVGKFLDIMMEEPGDSAVVLSFCDGEHARIACQPISAPDGYDFPTEVTIGYAINPDGMCHELVKCYEECVPFAENAYGGYEDMDEEMNEVRDWADRHIQDLRAATEDD